ncbi:NAD(P)-dependent dehydrogenase (short-subunit alcohol dehydrogenase family) [Rhizobium sp. BK181]|nr:NAD(P)-dependent dehydrogenase (short-subunit alcohol dehydrogenase family) [Rhizobium sp. BK181]
MSEKPIGISVEEVEDLKKAVKRSGKVLQVGHMKRFFAEREGLEIGQKMAEVTATIPYGRFANPLEVAEVAVFLASTRAEYVFGQTFNVDGGNVLS